MNVSTSQPRDPEEIRIDRHVPFYVKAQVFCCHTWVMGIVIPLIFMLATTLLAYCTIGIERFYHNLVSFPLNVSQGIFYPLALIVTAVSLYFFINKIKHTYDMCGFIYTDV